MSVVEPQRICVSMIVLL